MIGTAAVRPVRTPARFFSRKLALAILLASLLAAAFFMGRANGPDQAAESNAATDLDWLGAPYPVASSHTAWPEWIAPVDEILFSRLDFRGGGGGVTHWTSTYEGVTEAGVAVLLVAEVERQAESDPWMLVQLLSTPVNPDGPTLLPRRVEMEDGRNWLDVIYRGSPDAFGEILIEYDAVDGERKSVVAGNREGPGFGPTPIYDAVGLGNITWRWLSGPSS